MVYLKRDKSGKIIAVYNEKTDEASETADVESPDVLAFFSEGDDKTKYQFLISDLQLIRVLEDLIDILIEKNIITITDFPAPVISKLLDRQRIRQHLFDAGGMEFYDDEDDQ